MKHSNFFLALICASQMASAFSDESVGVSRTTSLIPATRMPIKLITEGKTAETRILSAQLVVKNGLGGRSYLKLSVDQETAEILTPAVEVRADEAPQVLISLGETNIVSLPLLALNPTLRAGMFYTRPLHILVIPRHEVSAKIRDEQVLDFAKSRDPEKTYAYISFSARITGSEGKYIFFRSETTATKAFSGTKEIQLGSVDKGLGAMDALVFPETYLGSFDDLSTQKISFGLRYSESVGTTSDVEAAFKTGESSLNLQQIQETFSHGFSN